MQLDRYSDISYYIIYISTSHSFQKQEKKNKKKKHIYIISAKTLVKNLQYLMNPTSLQVPVRQTG